jgi:hypothetical protein
MSIQYLHLCDKQMIKRIFMRIKIKPFNVVDRNELPEVTVDRVPVEGDPLEIDSQMYFVCETINNKTEGTQTIGVIPLVIKNTTKIKDIGSYLESLNVALRRMQYLRKISVL